MPGAAELEARIPNATPEDAYRRVREIVVRAGSTIVEEVPPSGLRARQGEGQMLLTFDVRVDATPTGVLVHMSVTSPTDWDAHVRFRRRQLRDCYLFLALGSAFAGGAIAAGALLPTAGSGPPILATLAASFFLGFGLVAGITASARYRQAKRFADARGAVLHFGDS